MSLFLAATALVQVVPIAQIDLAAPNLYVSPAARAAVDTRAVTSLICLDLPARSRKYRTACLTPVEWDKAAEESKREARRPRTPEELNGLRYSAPPIPPVPYQTYRN